MRRKHIKFGYSAMIIVAEFDKHDIYEVLL